MRNKHVVCHHFWPYSSLRFAMKTGDVLFRRSTSGHFSRLIERRTGPVTHVGLVEKSDDGTRERVQIIESTTLNRRSGKKGVQRGYLSDFLTQSDEEGSQVWVGILATKDLNAELMLKWCDEQNGKPYGYIEAISAGISQITRGFLPSIDVASHLICSGVVAGALGVSSKEIRAQTWWKSSPTPWQLAADWPIYTEFHQLCGEKADILRRNNK